MKKITFILFAMLAFSLQSYAQDDCATATVITPGAFTATAITVATSSGIGGGAGVYNAAWFSYTPAGDGTIDISSCLGGADTRLFVHTDCAGPSIASTDDNCAFATDGTGNNYAAELTGVAVTGATTYYIEWDDRWTAGNSFDWSLTFTPAPLCQEATGLVATTLSGDVTATVAWNVEASATVGYNWAVMTSGEDPAVITNTPVSSGTTAVGVITDTATALTAGSSYDFYVQSNCDAVGLSTWAGPFSFTATAPPVEDICSGAIPITVGTNGVCAAMAVGNSTASTNSDLDPSTPAATCTSFNGGDIWFSLVVPASGNVTISGDASPDCCSYLWYEVYEGSDCTALTSVQCSATNGNDPSGFEMALTGRTPGETLYIRAWDSSNDNGPGDFNMCAFAPPTCPDATNFAVANILDVSADLSWTEIGTQALTYYVEVYLAGESAANMNSAVFSDAAVTGTTLTATGLSGTIAYDAYITTSCSGATPNSGLVGPISFTTTASCTDVSGVSADNITAATVDVVYTAGTGNDSVLVEVYLTGESAVGMNSPVYTNAAATSPQAVTGLDPLTGYDIYVMGSCGGTGTTLQGPISFTTTGVPPANDACADAITINDGDVLMGDSTYATNVEALTPCSGGGDCGGGTGTINFGAGVWYTYTSAAAEQITVDLVNSDYDSEIQVFSGVCGSLVCVGGDDDSSPGSDGFICFTSTATGATPVDYYFYVDGHNTGSGNYSIALTVTPAPPANDDCGAATALVLGTDTAFDNTGASDSGQVSCYSGTVSDLWYSFVVPTTGAGGTGEITITVPAGIQYALFSGCTTADEVSCNMSTNIGLTGGATYYISVTDDGTVTKAPGSSTLKVEDTTTLSTSDFSNGLAFSYYPNPVKNTLTLNAQQAITNVAVFNMLGQEVIRTAPNAVSNAVDMSNLQSGPYFVQVTVGTAVETVRVIKN
ncbi:T9SS type A sorting domain-containing protein [Lacinutrix jangbogonensis]|uniref:T9SS type A sorting domain-containing protein n=1 Tax=Lacinutrix jangbogonensis TaxID=1469557 RepID=UPI00053E147A|nr:T9SS type A sorting domain-containing protein [Lacinutrix jangbogonensis]